MLSLPLQFQLCASTFHHTAHRSAYVFQSFLGFRRLPHADEITMEPRVCVTRSWGIQCL